MLTPGPDRREPPLPCGGWPEHASGVAWDTAEEGVVNQAGPGEGKLGFPLRVDRAHKPGQTALLGDATLRTRHSDDERVGPAPVAP